MNKRKLTIIGFTLLGLGVFLSLGTWQVLRAQLKNQQLDQYALSVAQPPVRVTQGSQLVRGTHVTLTGTLTGQQTLLLQNQSWQKQQGYRVWQPLRTSWGMTVMVDLGWIPPQQRHLIDTQNQSLTLTGVLHTLPLPGMRAGHTPCPASRWPYPVYYPNLADLQCYHQTSQMYDGVLLLDQHASNQLYKRDWQGLFTPMPASTHYGYAMTWYSFALISLFLGALFWRRTV